MSESRDKFRFVRFKANDGRKFLEKLRYMSGTVRRDQEWQRFWELAERDELEQCFKPFRKEFPGVFN